MNYVIIYPDELRSESLGCYGHPVVQTPNIDALANEGTLFEQNYSANPVCVSSRCSLVSGWYPHVNGHRSQRNLMTLKEPNFWQYLKDEDWTIALIGKDDCFSKEETDMLFDEHPPFPIPSNHLGDDGTRENNYYSLIMDPLPEFGKNCPGDRRITEQTKDFLNRHSNDDKPFCLWVNFLFPHAPYHCPEPWYSMYMDKELPLRSDDWRLGKPELYELTRYYHLSHYEDPETFHKMNAIYLGMITYVDSLIGEVIQSLKDNGLYEDTTIILCSDHGDFAGDAGLTEKHPNALDDMLTRVPLIIRRPGCPGKHRINALTQSLDIFPTIFDFENLEIKHDQFGVSLKDQVNGLPGDGARAVYAEAGYDTREPQCFENAGDTPEAREIMHEGTIYYPKFAQQELSPESLCRSVMRRDRNTKVVIRTNGDNELYDIANDPQEYNNLYLNPAYKPLFHELAYKTLQWMIHTSDVVPRLTEPFKVWYTKKNEE